MVSVRRPLEWLDLPGGRGQVPACDGCLAWLSRPGAREACASVGIEHGRSADETARQAIERWHAAGHRKG